MYWVSPFVYTYLLTYSMVQSPSWKANWFAASQEIPHILWNPKVHYRTHKPPPPAPILGQPNPVHIPTSHLLEIHPNITHPSMPRSPQWSLSLRFPQQDPIHPLSSPIRATCPTHFILLDFITRTILGEEFRSLSSSLCARGLRLVGCPRLLIQFIRSYPPYRRPFLYPQPEDAPCRGDRDPLRHSHLCIWKKKGYEWLASTGINFSEEQQGTPFLTTTGMKKFWKSWK